MTHAHWLPQDDPKAVSFDVARRLKAAGYPQTLARLGWAKKPGDDSYRLYPVAESEVAAPNATELLAYYLDGGTFSTVTAFARPREYLALDESDDARAATLDDAVGELALKKLTK